MIKNKFFKNLFQSISNFLVIMIFIIFLLIGFFESLNFENNFGWILLVISLVLIILYFIIGFYWIFQKVIIDESGIRIVFFNKIIKDCKWEEVDTIEEVNFMRNPGLRVKLCNGSEIHLDKRKRIIDVIRKYIEI